jgi:predicted TIM-barrel fold metal-dependent hydrolase
MKGKIGLEEHFSITDTLGDSQQYFTPDKWPEFKYRLLDIHERRLAEMDENEIEFAVISLNSPAIQAILNPQQAIDMAKRANDFLAEQIAKQPKRFAGFAALPMQNPDAAIAELQRTVKDYGFKGALVNGFTQLDVDDSSVYYDLPQYEPFWAEMEKLDLPFYMHPRSPLPSQRRIYEGHRWLIGAAWGFGVETATHSLRLMGSGLFDKYPKLKIILGHLGEMLPNSIWRTSHRISIAPRGVKSQKPFYYYLQNNFYVTTSGNFHLPTMLAAMLEMGSDRVLFSTDYPFEQMSEASTWFDAAEISDIEREKIGRLNAKKLFKLDFLD